MTNFKDQLPPTSWKYVLALGLALIAGVVLSSQQFPTVGRSQIAVKAQSTQQFIDGSFKPGEQENRDRQPKQFKTADRDPSKKSSVKKSKEAATRPLPTSTPTARPTATPTPVVHIVSEGDMPVAIAAVYDIDVDTLLEVNDVNDPTLLQVGQKLLIPTTLTPAPLPTFTPLPSPTPKSLPVHHTVEEGDTLLGIAIEYDTTIEVILIANDIDNPDALRVGQELLIPPSDMDFGTKTVVHKITSGDTFGYLSFFYGSTIEDILAANPDLDPNNLQIGQKVVIPVTSLPINPKASSKLARVTLPDPPAPGQVPLQQAVFNAINRQREQYGLAPYIFDADLVDLARAHAQDMLSRGYFSHTTPEGITLNDRFQQKGLNINWTGENIQRNIKPKDQTVAYAMNWWMSSYIHRSNILHNHYNSIGVGVTEGPPGWHTFVLVFAERESPSEAAFNSSP